MSVQAYLYYLVVVFNNKKVKMLFVNSFRRFFFF